MAPGLSCALGKIASQLERDTYDFVIEVAAAFTVCTPVAIIPLTSRVDFGFIVPIPTFPSFLT